MVTKFLAIFMHLRNSGGSEQFSETSRAAAEGSTARAPGVWDPTAQQARGCCSCLSFLHPSLLFKTGKCQPAARHTSAPSGEGPQLQGEPWGCTHAGSHAGQGGSARGRGARAGGTRPESISKSFSEGKLE